MSIAPGLAALRGAPSSKPPGDRFGLFRPNTRCAGNVNQRMGPDYPALRSRVGSGGGSRVRGGEHRC